MKTSIASLVLAAALPCMVRAADRVALIPDRSDPHGRIVALVVMERGAPVIAAPEPQPADSLPTALQAEAGTPPPPSGDEPTSLPTAEHSVVVDGSADAVGEPPLAQVGIFDIDLDQRVETVTEAPRRERTVELPVAPFVPNEEGVIFVEKPRSNAGIETLARNPFAVRVDVSGGDAQTQEIKFRVSSAVMGGTTGKNVAVINGHLRSQGQALRSWNIHAITDTYYVRGQEEPVHQGDVVAILERNAQYIAIPLARDVTVRFQQ